MNIAKASAEDVEISDAQKPSAINGLVYTGEGQALVTAPGELPEGYTGVQYSTDGETWTDTLPTGTNAGEHTVHVKYVGGANHADFAGDEITVTIAPASGNKDSLTDAQKPGAINGLVYTGEEQTLVTAPSELPDGYTKVQYSTDGENWSDDIPTGTLAGDHTVYVKYVGDASEYCQGQRGGCGAQRCTEAQRHKRIGIHG